MALVEVEELSKKYSPIRVWPKDMEFNLLPLGVTFIDVKILPKKELAKSLAPLIIKKVEADISLLSLLKGKLRLSRLELYGADITWIQKSSLLLQKMADTSAEDLKSNSSKVRVPIDWEKFYNIPIDQFSLNNLSIQVRIAEPEISFKVTSLSLDIFNRYKAILLDMKAPKIRIKKTKQDPILDMGVEVKTLFEEKGLRVSGIKINRKNSFVVASGIVSGDFSSLDFTDAKIKTRSHFQLSEVKNLVNEFFPKIPLPDVTGTADIDFELNELSGLNTQAKLKLKTKSLSIDGFEVGRLSAQGQLSQDRIDIKSLSIQNRSGRVSTHDAWIERKSEKTTFSAKLETEDLEIGEMLQTLKIPKIPLHLVIKGKLPCTGEVHPSFNLKCDGKLTGHQLGVQSGLEKNAFKIVNIDKFGAEGWVKVDANKVEYDTNVSHETSVGGHSRGTISYTKGFDIHYKAEKFPMAELKNLAQLKLEGDISLKGRTVGNSNFARFYINSKTKNAWLDDFKIGDSAFLLSYKKSMLYFNNIKGKQNNTRFTGNVKVNLKQDRISAKFNVPFLDVDDVRSALGRHWELPFPVSGTGSAKVQVNGPFEVTKLNFDLTSKIYRGTLAGETFDLVNLDLFSKNQRIKTRQVSIQRGKSHIELTGTVDPNGKLDGVAIGRSLKIEQSENLEKLNLNLSGVMDLNVKLENKIESPVVKVNGRVTNMIVGDQPTQDSFFQFRVDTQEMAGSGSFIGDVVKTKFRLPIAEGSPLKIYLKTTDWDFSNLFNVFSNVAVKQDYKTSLTSENLFESKSGHLKDGHGKFVLQNFMINRGPLFMKTKAPGSLNFKNGSFKAENLKLFGEGTYLELRSRPNTKTSPLNLSLQGKVDLSLATLVTPFLDDLQGDASINIDLSGKVDDLEMKGSLFIKNGLLKLIGLPHAFIQSSADILFNKKSVLFNSVKGKFANGNFSADGKAEFKSITEIPIIVNSNISNAEINIPKGFLTQGSGDLTITGNHFPYHVRGTYNVSSGLIKADFDKSESNIKLVQPSHFLPKFLLQKKFSPIDLGINVHILQPLPVEVTIAGIDIQSPVNGTIKITGTPEAPLLTGRIHTYGSNGKFTFRSNDFDIQHASISYKNSSPETPLLNVEADTRIQEYDINLKVVGSAEDPQIAMASQPVLPETEILSLLALGMTTQPSVNLQTEGPTGVQTSLQIGSALINQQLGIGKEIKKRLGVDFEISSDYDEEANDNVHRFTFKKQWTPKFGASASRSIGTSPVNKFRLEYKLKDGLSVIGNYETHEKNQNEQDGEAPNKSALDLEYKVKFGE